MSEYIGPKKPPQLAIDAGVMNIAAPAAPGDADEALDALCKRLLDADVGTSRIGRKAADAIERLRLERDQSAARIAELERDGPIVLDEVTDDKGNAVPCSMRKALEFSRMAAAAEGRRGDEQFARIAELEGAFGELFDAQNAWASAGARIDHRSNADRLRDAWANARQLIKGKHDE